MPVLPTFDPRNFSDSLTIDHPYFPLTPGQIKSYRSEVEDEDTGEVTVENNDIYATFLTKTVSGIETLVVRDTAYEDGRLVEDTLDYFAQDDDGNVWYMGESVFNYRYDDDGNYVSTDHKGSFEAGVDGALGGHLIQADPHFGSSYYQEFAPGIAVDEAIVVGLGEEVEGPHGSFEDVVQTLETTELEPDLAEYKFYAPGVGLVREEGVSADGEIDQVVDLDGVRTVGHGTDMAANAAAAASEDVGDEGDAEDDEGKDVDIGDLHETETVDAGSVHGPDVEDFEGDGGALHVTFLGETAGYDSALGAYIFDLDTGVIGEGRILIDSTEDAEAGQSFDIEVGEGEALGLFLFPDGAESGLDLSQFEDGGLFFTNMLTGGAATVGDQLAPLLTDEAGTALPITALHALGAEDGFNFLNPAAGVQAIELDSVLLGEDSDIALVGFEDQLATLRGHDDDFNDVIVAVSDEAIAPPLLSGLIDEIDHGAPAPELMAA